MLRLPLAAVLAALLLAPQQPAANYDESKVPAYKLPPLLGMSDGSMVRDAATWTRRREEIRVLLESQMFGRVPAAAAADKASFKVVASDPAALGGKALRKEVAIEVGGRTLNLLLYLPARAPGRVPVFVGLGFHPNQSVAADPGIRLAGEWAQDKSTGRIALQAADESSRGSAASRWQVEKLLSRGYGLATAYYGDIEPDIVGALKLGVRARYLKPGQDTPAADEWGAIAAWAWGLGRMVDYLATDSNVDVKRLAVIGHSRLGKTALWAGAMDARFVMVISNDSGEGGAAISRRVFGETVADLNTRFPHWFCGNYKKWNGRELEMPFDSHMLLALAAPRPLYVASAEEDQWADPKGEFLGAFHASAAWNVVGLRPLNGAVAEAALKRGALPPVNTPVGEGRIRYHVRTGKHDITAYDWDQYLDFADKHM
jgi:hypothetical protein